MGITFGGLASGLDTDGIISGLMSIEKLPLTALQKRQTNLDSAKTTLSGLSTKMLALRDAADKLATANSFASYSVTSSDSAIVASAAGTSAPGSFSLQVNALAREQRTYSDAQASSAAALNLSGTLSLTVGANAAVDVTVAAGDSLATIASKINGSGAAVTASVLYDGGSYRLQVRGKDTGAANAVSFGESGFSLGLSSPANTAQAAQDASLTIDGIAITRPTNQVTGVIEGVTLALTKVTTSPAEIKVAADPDALASKIEAFVTAYNDVVKTSHGAAGYGSVAASNQELQSDSTVRTLLDRLGRIANSNVAGTTGKYTTLRSAGIKAQNDGTLKLDQAALKEALAADSTAISRLFVGDGSAGSGAMNAFKAAAKDLADGSESLLGIRIESYSARSRRLTTDIDKMNLRIEQREKTLRAQFSALETRVTNYSAQFTSLTAMLSSSSSS